MTRYLFIDNNGNMTLRPVPEPGGKLKLMYTKTATGITQRIIPGKERFPYETVIGEKTYQIRMLHNARGRFIVAYRQVTVPGERQDP